MFNYQNYTPVTHRYYLFSTGTDLKARYFDTRKEALNAMYKYCEKHNIKVELTEDDRHEKKYSNHNGVRFYINRV